MPILTTTIPRLRVVGADDHEELVADAIASAAAMLHSAEQCGKPLMPRSVAHYCIQRAKVGRKSTSAGRTDVLSPATQLDGNAVVHSLDQVVAGVGLDGELTLGQMLASPDEDAAIQAGRNLDWAAFLATESSDNRKLVRETAKGTSGTELSNHWGVSPARISQRKRQLAVSIRRSMGNTILVDVQGKPVWDANLRVCRERALHSAWDGNDAA